MKLHNSILSGFAAGLLLFSGCSNTDDSDDTTSSVATVTTASMVIPSRISVVGGETTTVAASIARAFDAVGTEYSSASVETYNDDFNQMQQVEMFLGILNESSYLNFVNAGKYIAMVNEGEDGGSDSSQKTKKLMKMVFDVTRADDTSPLIVKIWHIDKTQGSHTAIFKITKGASDTYPFGEFKFSFAGATFDANNVWTVDSSRESGFMYVTAEDSKVKIEMKQSFTQGSETGSMLLNMLANTDFSEGVLKAENTFGTAGSYYDNVAFNANYVKSKKSGSYDGTNTFSEEGFYDKNVEDELVHRYKIFNKETGTELKMISGIPFTGTDSAGNTGYGYASYWGLWQEGHMNLKTGDTVTNQDDKVDYKLVKTDGKLVKHSKKTTTLSALDGVELSTWTGSGEGIVQWNSTLGKFQNVATVTWGDNGKVITELATPTNYTPSSYWDGWTWCEALRTSIQLGSLYFDNSNSAITAPTNASTITYHTQETVTAADITSDKTLYHRGWEIGSYDAAGVNGCDGNRSAYFNASTNTQKTYTLAKDTMILKDGSSNNVILPSDLNWTSVQSGACGYGYTVGPLTEDSTLATESAIRSADVYYEWTTGREWNSMVGLKNATTGAYVSFDKPKTFMYEHTTTKDRDGSSAYDGKKFYIDYDGYSLNVPWNYDANSSEWRPQFGIKDGNTIADANGTEYVTKAVAIATKLRKLATDPDSSLVLDTSSPTFTESFVAADVEIGDVDADSLETKVVEGQLLQ